MSKKITIYYSDSCGHCTNLKEWLTEKDVPFTALNSSEPDVTKFLIERDVQGVPFTIIEDELTGEKEEITGFGQAKFESILGL